MDKAMVVQMKLHAEQFLTGIKNVEKGLKTTEASIGSMRDGMNQLKAAGALALGYLGAGGVKELVTLGAKAKQSEESFRLVAKSAGESADEIVFAMEKASAGTIDASQLMQKATKGMMLGLSGGDMVKISEMARQSARTLGIDVSQAFDQITDSISTKMPRALKSMGFITKEQMGIMNAAISAGVENVDLLGIAYSNFQTQEKKMGALLSNEAEQIQTLKAQWEDFKETIGSSMVGVIYGLLHPIDFLTKSLKDQSTQIETTIDDLELLRQVASKEGYIAKPEEMGVPFRGKITGAPDFGVPSESRFIKSPVEQMMAQLKIDTFKAQTDFEALIKEGVIGAGEVPTLIERFAGREKDWKKYLDGRKADYKALVDHQKLLTDATAKMQADIIPVYEVPTAKETLAMDFRSQEIRNRQIEESLKLEEAATQRRYEMQNELGMTYEVATEVQQAAMLIRTIEREKKAAEDAMRPWVELSASTAEAMERNFSSLFIDVMQGKLTSFSDFWQATWATMQRIASDYLGMIAKDFLFGEGEKKGGGGGLLGKLFSGGGGLAGLFGGGGAAAGAAGGAEAFSGLMTSFVHSGGMMGRDSLPQRTMPASMMLSAPRLHSGLAGDEMPAILQKGETVIPKGGGMGGGGQFFNININAVDARSFSELAARNPGAIVGPFLTALQKGGQLRNALREAT